MTIALAALAGVLALGYIPLFWLVLRHLKDRDALERDERARDAAERDTAAARHARQVSDLCSRLQHPEIVIHTPDPAAVQADEELPLSDEEMAERELYLERIENLEREGVAP